MASTYSNLKFELITTGEQSGSWGATTNTNIGTAIEQAMVGMATLTSANFSTNVATLTLTNTNTAQNARALCLVISAASLSAAGTINVPAIQKPYLIINNDSFAVTVKVSGLTGVVVPAGKRTVVYNNGTDVGNQIDYLASLSLGAALPVTSGGTGVTTSTGTGSVVLSASPTFTGSPVLPTGATGVTQSAGNNSTALSTTAYTDAAIIAERSATATLTNKTLTSPSLSDANLTGTPVAPTAATNTNTTQVATTAFVVAQIADDAPTKTGGGASGTWNISITGGSSNPAQLSTASGSAPSYSARAWVNWNGTGTVAIRGSANVSSITDNSSGNYTVNFSTAMPNANYSTVLGQGSGGFRGFARLVEAGITASSVNILFTDVNGGNYDESVMTAAIFA